MSARRARSPSDPTERARTALHASLRYVRCADVGMRRVKKAKGFVYLLPNGHRVTKPGELERIRKLGLPPAWSQVWICLDPHGHLQATGYDAKGRKQYRYAARWRAARDDVKFHDLVELAQHLPRLRRRLAHDLASTGLGRDKVLASVVSLLIQTGARIGNARYREQNGSFGLTTLLDRHAKITSSSVELLFRGKGGKPYRASVRDRKLARVVRACRDVPGQRLFQYRADDGSRQYVESGDVNAYVQRSGSARLTAKTFRTWTASVLALSELRTIEPARSSTLRKRQLNSALRLVADELGNTLAICRKSYVHPVIMQAFLDDVLPTAHAPRRSGLSTAESDLLALLSRASQNSVAA